MSKQKWLYLLAAFVCLLGVVWLTPESKGLTLAGKKSIGVAVFAIIVWVSQALDDAISGLVIVFLLAAMGATKLGEAFSGYANTAVWLIVIGFIMAGCMEKSGLSKRIALMLVNAARGSALKVYWAVALVMVITSFLIPSITARTLLMLPIIVGIGQSFGAREGQSNIVKALLFIVAMSGTMMSAGILTAHVGNPITVGLIEAATRQTVSWAEWFRIGAPPAFLLAAISVFVLQKMWVPEVKNLGQGQDFVARELQALGKLGSQEKYTLVVFLITLALWATDSIHAVNVVLVGLVAVVLLLWPGSGIMTWKEAQQKVPWNIFVLYGAGLSMGTALVSSGAAKWLAGTMLGPIAAMPYATQMIVLIWIATALQIFFTGGGPKTTALTPIVIAHAVAIGANPLTFALILGMNMQHQYLLPVSNMPNAIAIGTGHVTSNEIIRTGAVMSMLAAVVMSVMVLTYWTWLGVVQ